jgi:polynucleotide 5'-hydroxyl-kinase GRC3/NOL9
MLAGIYTILPLQNPLNILSTTLYPSSRPIPVFGPSSHPTPVIAPSTSRKRIPSSEFLRRLPLPHTFNVGESRTVFLIREYECGFQGLRNGVVPGFSNIWGDSRGLLNLRGVHLVCLHPTHLRSANDS